MDGRCWTNIHARATIHTFFLVYLRFLIIHGDGLGRTNIHTCLATGTKVLVNDSYQ
jgi:hypothetical protein